MDNLDGAIGFKVGLDNSQLVADSVKTKDLLRGIATTGSEAGSRIGNAFNMANGMIGMLGIGAVGSIGMLGRTIMDVTAKFEKFGIVLKNTLGEAKGADALNMIANFAATTPFQLDEVTGAFIKMANQGFVPTRQEMVKLGDLASSTGKSFDQLAEAILDANTGQFERLKEFGIKASQNGDRVTFSFKEQKTTVENTNSAIQKYLLSLGDMKGVAGANEKISASLTGQISNLGDKVGAMFNQIGTANKGFLYAAVGGAATLIDNYETVGEAIGALIGIYGVYKVAVMAVTYSENAKAASIARTTAIETEAAAIMAGKGTATTVAAAANTALIITEEARAAATQVVIAAEKELAVTSKASSLANPYVLAAMAVAALGYAIYKVINMQSEMEKSQEALNKTVRDSNQSIEAERLELDAMFARLNAAKDGTTEYDAAKAAIFSRYGEQLKLLGDEKTALNDIALAYKTITEESTKAAKARGMAEATSQATQTAATVTGASRTRINELLQQRFKGQTGADGIGLAETYFAKIVPILEGKEEMTKEIQDLINSFQEKTAQVTGGAFNTQYIVTTSNEMEEEFKKVAKAKSIMDKILADARIAFGEVETATTKEAKKELTTYNAQINALRKTKSDIEREIAILKTTPGEDPMKAVIAKQGQLDEINKKLGVKENEKVLGAYDRITAAIKTTADAVVNASEKERPALQEKLALLVKQQEAWENLIKAQRGETTDLKPLKIHEETLATKTVDSKTLSGMKTLTEEQKKQLQIKLDQINQGREAEEQLEREAILRENILEIAQNLTGQLEKQGILSQAEAELIDGTLSAIKTGNLWAMAAQAASMIISMFPQTAAAKYEEQIRKINQALRDQQRLKDQAGRTGGEKDARDKELEILKQKKAADEKALAEAQKKLDAKIFDFGPVYWDRVHKVRELEQAIKDDQDAIEDADLGLSDFLSGGLTQTTIADTIAKGFQDAKTSVDDFGDYMSNVLMDAAMEIFKTQYLLPDINKYLTPVINEALKDNQITISEKENIDKATKFIADRNKGIWDNLTGNLDKGTGDDRTASSKGFTAMNQDTASELNGRFTTMQGHTFSINQGVQILAANSATILKHLAGIERNTSRLESIEQGIGQMKTGIDTINLKGIVIKK